MMSVDVFTGTPKFGLPKAAGCVHVPFVELHELRYKCDSIKCGSRLTCHTIAGGRQKERPLNLLSMMTLQAFLS